MGLKTTALRSNNSSPACGTIFRTQSMAAVRFSLGKGVKRKRGEDDGGQPGAARASHGFHCGTLLDLSLLKLHQSCVLAEHNLRRSVLIANALRRLQAEICRESGRDVPPASPSEPAERPADGANRPVPASGPAAGSADLNNNLPAPSRAETPFCLLSGNDSSLSSAISTILQDLDVVEDLSPPPGQLSLEDDHLLPLKPVTPDPQGEPRPPDSIFAAFEITDSNDFLVDGSLDAIFEDIDTSMYDAQQGFSAGAWGLAKAPPSPASQPVKASRGSPSPKAHNSRTDFTELENLMELLVN